MRMRTAPSSSEPKQPLNRLHRLVKPAILVSLLMAMVALVPAQQAPAFPSLQIGIEQAGNRDQVSTSLQILALLTILSLAPALLILTTAFTRIIIVLSFVRSALGTMNIPPNPVLVGLSLFLTFYVMAPTYQQVYEQALQPYMRAENPISFEEALQRAQGPVRDFMLRNTYESDLKMFLELRGERPQTREEVPMTSLIPAFVISELKTAFIIGFYIFVPFIIIDLIIASLLMGMGMMMMPPVVVSLPVKLLVFVLADGWSVLVRALITGFH